MGLTDFVDVLTPQFMLAAITERDPDMTLARNFLWRRKFPPMDIPEDEFSWELLREQGILAGFFGPDGKPLPATEIDNDIARGTIGRVMAMRSISATDVNNLREMATIASANPEAMSMNVLRSKAERHQKKVADAILSMDDQIERQLEYMACGALTGAIYWPPRDPVTNTDILPTGQLEPYWGKVRTEVELPFPEINKQSATTLVDANANAGTQVAWTDTANADIVADMDMIADILSDESGADTSNLTFILSKKMMRAIAANEKILGMIRGNGTFPTPAGALTQQQVRTFVADMFGWTFEVYDQVWTYATGKPTERQTVHKVRYIAEDTIIIHPTGVTPGRMLMSPHKGPNAVWATGKLPWIKNEDTPPYNTELGIAINAWPMNQRWDTVMVFKAGS